MANASIASEAPGRPRYGSMSRDRTWALRWSYFFLVLFAIFFLMPPIYMLITSLKTSAEISAATNPWWINNPTLQNYIDLLSQNQFLVFFRNSAIVSICVVILTMMKTTLFLSPWVGSCSSLPAINLPGSALLDVR